MTQAEFKTKRNPNSQIVKLKAIFEASPDKWLSMPELGEQIGAWAVHSRVADLRKLGLRIEHRNDWIVCKWWEDGQRRCNSFYKYVP